MAAASVPNVTCTSGVSAVAWKWAHARSQANEGERVGKRHRNGRQVSKRTEDRGKQTTRSGGGGGGVRVCGVSREKVAYEVAIVHVGHCVDHPRCGDTRLVHPILVVHGTTPVDDEHNIFVERRV